MRILLLNQFFHPDISALAQLTTDLAEDLAKRGHQVTVLTGRGAYLGGVRLPSRESWRGVEIVRVPSTSRGKGTMLGRIVDYSSYFALAAIKALLLPRADVVVATTNPPGIASLGAMLRIAKGTRFVYWVQDVYPELAVQFGVLDQRALVVRAFEAVQRATLSRADLVVAIGGEMAMRVRKKDVPADRVLVLPNWADGEAIRPVARGANRFRSEQGLDGKTVVLYSGNMGRAHDMTTLLEAARLLRDRQGIVFAFIGEGAKRAEVEAAARELPSIRFFPYQPRSALAESLSAGDIHAVTQDSCTLGLVEPSKLYGVMAAGRPVLYIGPATSEVARTVAREQFGAVIANGDGQGAAGAILDLAGRCEELGARARTAFEREYARARRTEAFASLLEQFAPA